MLRVQLLHNVLSSIGTSVGRRPFQFKKKTYQTSRPLTYRASVKSRLKILPKSRQLPGTRYGRTYFHLRPILFVAFAFSFDNIFPKEK